MGAKNHKKKRAAIRKEPVKKKSNKGLIIGCVTGALIIALTVVLLFVFGVFGKKEESKESKMPQGYDNPTVTMEIENYGTIEWELYPDIAPNTVCNIISLINKGFYDDNTIHRVQSGFVLQGGDPTGTGSGGPGYSIKGEFTSNNFKNDLSHTRGVLSMARRSDSYDSAGSQFFVCLSNACANSLDGDYASFGKVTKGMDIIDKIEADVGTSSNMGMLSTSLRIVKTTVDTKGATYPEPEVIK
ncbi:MAG: peptidylprolyl isomerase [Clostridia bacterium]|nr:peptidylprolyl isomerase [Clostridia bacterium]